MLNTTYDAVRAVLKADASITVVERTHLLALCRHGPSAAKPETESTSERIARIIRRAEASRRLSVSLRTIDKLAASGALTKRKLPGRIRASGFLESDLAALITKGAQ